MEAFSPSPPDWAQSATHATEFCCPRCGAASHQAKAVWLNRRSPVYGTDHRRKWQEFYHCGECATPWWAWSSDRPPSPYDTPENTPEGGGGFNDLNPLF